MTQEAPAVIVPKKAIDFQKFKVRCSSIHMAMADSKDNPCITEKQAVRLLELQGKEKKTTGEWKMRLLQKRLSERENHL